VNTLGRQPLQLPTDIVEVRFMMMQRNSSPGLSSLFAATAKSNGLLLGLTVGKIRNSANSKLVKVEFLAAFVKLGYRKGCYIYVASRCKSKTR
jgi:hypothetical protein